MKGDIWDMRREERVGKESHDETINVENGLIIRLVSVAQSIRGELPVMDDFRFSDVSYESRLWTVEYDHFMN